MKQSVSTSSPEIKKLFEAAKAARENSYSPYSRYKVGASILTRDGKLYSGCNIENSSFGATVCAERVAIQKAVSELGQIELREIMVVTDASPPWPPCGLCRQVMSEFGQSIRIYTANLKDEIMSFDLSEIFPHAFTPDRL